MFDMAMLNLRLERDAQLIGDWLIYDVHTVWWRFLTPAQRAERATALEALLRARLDETSEPGLKSTRFAALRNVAIEAAIPGLPLVEADETAGPCDGPSRRGRRVKRARCPARPHHRHRPRRRAR